MAYRGYMIIELLTGGCAIAKDTCHIAYASSPADARKIIDSLLA